MKIVTLMENTAIGPEFLAEHGLSYYLEACGKRILFDFGQSEKFLANADRLGVDLSKADGAVLSHGHYDHGGGISAFLAKNDRAMVYACPSAVDNHYNAAGKDISIPCNMDPKRLVWSQNGDTLGPGLTLLQLCAPPEDNGGMTAEIGGQIRPEDFRHEQYLLVEEGGKRVLISGCSHKGVVQIAEHYRPDVLVGGFHFMKIQDRAVLEEKAERLLCLPTVYYTGHCTGEGQYGILKKKMGNRLRYLAAGSSIEI